MPLDDREQQILKEIERQFYEEDPELANAVRTISGRRLRRWADRLAIAGIVVGIIILLTTFRFNPFLSLSGFLLIVISTTAVLRSNRRRGEDENDADGPGGWWDSWSAKFRNGRRFRPPS